MVKKISLISAILLLIWFLFDMFGLKIGDSYLVQAAWDDVDGIWYLLFIACFIIFCFKERLGKYILTGFLFLWGIAQFFSHWYYTIFGASEKKLEVYNNFFADTYHIIPASKNILIPDFYHIVLHILILVSFIFLSILCFKSNKCIEA